MPVQKPVLPPSEKKTQARPKIAPKPVMPAGGAAYLKRFEIYKEQAANREKNHGESSQRQDRKVVFG